MEPLCRTTPRDETCYFSVVPTELLVEIFSYLNKDLGTTWHVCRSFRCATVEALKQRNRKAYALMIKTFDRDEEFIDRLLPLKDGQTRHGVGGMSFFPENSLIFNKYLQTKINDIVINQRTQIEWKVNEEKQQRLPLDGITPYGLAGCYQRWKDLGTRYFQVRQRANLYSRYENEFVFASEHDKMDFLCLLCELAVLGDIFLSHAIVRHYFKENHTYALQELAKALFVTGDVLSANRVVKDIKDKNEVDALYAKVCVVLLRNEVPLQAFLYFCTITNQEHKLLCAQKMVEELIQGEKCTLLDEFCQKDQLFAQVFYQNRLCLLVCVAKKVLGPLV